MDATVRDLTYLGADRRLELDAPFGEVVVRVAAGSAVPAVGERTVLSWGTANASAFLEVAEGERVRMPGPSEGDDR